MPKKTCWESGYAHIVSNNLHGIRSGKVFNFKKIDDLPNTIKSAFNRSGIKVVRTSKDKEYKEALKKLKEAELTD